MQGTLPGRELINEPTCVVERRVENHLKHPRTAQLIGSPVGKKKGGGRKKQAIDGGKRGGHCLLQE